MKLKGTLRRQLILNILKKTIQLVLPTFAAFFIVCLFCPNLDGVNINAIPHKLSTGQCTIGGSARQY